MTALQLHVKTQRRSKVRFAPTILYAFGTKIVIRPLPCSSSSETGDAQVACSVASALAVALFHCQPVSGTGEGAGLLQEPYWKSEVPGRFHLSLLKLAGRIAHGHDMNLPLLFQHFIDDDVVFDE